MGRGHQGRSLRPFHVSQHHPSPPRLLLPRILNKPAGEGPRGQAGPGGSAFVAQSSTAAGRPRGRGRGPETLSRGLTPRCIVRRDPPPPPRPATRPAPSQRLPPPAAPTSRSPDQGPDVESSPQAGSGGAVHSAAPALSSRRLTPPPGRTLGPPASREPVSVRRPPRERPESRARRAEPRRCPSGKPGLRASRRGAGNCGGGGGGGRQADSGCGAAGEHARAAPLNGASSATPRPAAAAGDAAAPRAPAPAAPRLGSRWARALLRLWGVSGLRREETRGARCGGGVLCGGADRRPLSPSCSRSGTAAGAASGPRPPLPAHVLPRCAPPAAGRGAGAPAVHSRPFLLAPLSAPGPRPRPRGQPRLPVARLPEPLRPHVALFILFP